MWLQERKQIFRQWVESRWPSSQQIDLLTWKPSLRINPFAEEFIWQNGKLYKEVKNGIWQPETTRPMIPGPFGPIDPQSTIQPPKQPEWYVGDVPRRYITWYSGNSSGINLNNDQFQYTMQ